MSTDTPDFGATEAATTDETAAPEAAPAATADDLDLEVNDDANLDVDTPDADETEEVAEAKAADGGTAKAASTPRTKAPEGFVKPVEFAKELSKHLGKTVPPQVVYSYIKNNQGVSAKNPFPVHKGEDGYEWYIVVEEGLSWWDAKNTRVASGKAARAEKAAAKAAKPTEAEAASTEPVQEAE